MKTLPLCLYCGKKNVRKGSDFCTMRCAANQGEQFREGAMDQGQWCPRCEAWTQGNHDDLDCPAKKRKVTP